MTKKEEKEIINNIGKILEAADIKGKDVPAFCLCMSWLKTKLTEVDNGKDRKV